MTYGDGSAPTPDFGPRAATYDERHPPISGLHEELVARGALAGRRVLDAGCGTGRFASELVDRFGCEACGIDPEPRMLAVAAGRTGARLRVEQGTAERLPVDDGSFERVTMVLSAHLVDRPQAFAECRRALEPQGFLVVAGFDPATFEGYWLNRFFPSMLAADLRRFPSAKTLELDLVDAGFAETRVTRFCAPRSLTRVAALDRIRGRQSATFDLVPEEEFRAGLKKAEAELADPVVAPDEMLIAVAAT